MYIHRGLLLVFLVMIIFLPTIEDWITTGISEWYRPFVAWAGLIFIAWLGQRRYRKAL